ncbi:MAG: hemerythrin domain-containing protein [Bacteroidia bacterium]|nr:hemerythrin domain-containing protein [Bacteroidia bacterium]
MIRTDLFTAIHKAIRAQLFDAALRMQNLDIHNDEDVVLFIGTIRDRLAFLHEHADKEDTYVFPSVAEFDRELVNAVEREHDQLHLLTSQVEEALDQFASAPKEDRHEALSVVRRTFHQLVAGHLSHMNHEEEQILPATWRYLTEEQLQTILMNIQKNIPADRYTEWMYWMLPALQPQELAGMLRGMAASAPKEMVDLVLRVAERSVDEHRLARVLDLAGLKTAA